MNGEPLPLEHGFPVRMVVPGLYGYVSATKWVTDMELTTFDAFDAYWVERGWAAAGADQDRVADRHARSRSRRCGGRHGAVAGVAWAQHRGSTASRSASTTGRGTRPSSPRQDTIDTWRQWVSRGTPPPGNHTVQVRATDAGGNTQTAERVTPFPDGATGSHDRGHGHLTAAHRTSLPAS